MGHQEEPRSFDITDEMARVHSSVAAAQPPGSDPDSKLRLAKTLAAQGVDLPDGYSLDEVTEKDRVEHAEKADKDRDKLYAQRTRAQRDADEKAQQAEEDEEKDAKVSAAQKRAAASGSPHDAPQGRSATPPSKAKAAGEK
jgi:hypothetical protein